MHKLLSITTLAFLLSTTSADAQHPRLELEGHYWLPDISGSVEMEAGGLGTNLDLVSDLGIADENITQGRLTWHLNQRHIIRAFYTRMNYSGSETVTRTVSFEGRTFTAGTQVNSDVNLQYFGLGWIYRLFATADERLNVRTVLELKGVTGDVELRSPNTVPLVSESETFAGLLPTVGAAIEYEVFENWYIFGEITGMTAGNYGHFLDGEAGVTWQATDHVMLKGGYRQVAVHIETNEDQADFEFSGPFVAATVAF